MARQYSQEVERAIANASLRTGLPASTLRAFVGIESGGNPANRTGSYKGLLQLSDQEFARNGGQGNIFDIDANLSAGAAKLKAESDGFKQRFGREPTGAELYMMHQQGVGGSSAHWSNPDAPAWQNMASTAEGRAKGEGWAKQAIWGNVPDDVKRQFGSVDNMTSRDFTKLWEQKFARFGGDQPGQAPGQSPVLVADASPTPQASPPAASPSATPYAAPQERTPATAPEAGMFGSFKTVMAALGSPSGDDFASRNAPAAAPADGTVGGFASALGGGGLSFGSGKDETEDQIAAAPDPLAGLQMNRPKIDMVKLMQALRARADLGIA